jgi:hypothetical protein
MKSIAGRTYILWAAALFCIQTGANTLPQELRANLGNSSLSGQAKMSFWGFDVYNAALWIAPGFSPANYTQHDFALELSYLRDFNGAAIAQRSLQEMHRQGPLDAELAQRWEAQMRAVFPNVRAGDRITGLHQRGVGVQFWWNGKLQGTIRDTDFAKAFFGIWLSAQTSQPQLRQALLAGAQGTPLPAAAP